MSTCQPISINICSSSFMNYLDFHKGLDCVIDLLDDILI
jgi:hypothetical protein